MRAAMSAGSANRRIDWLSRARAVSSSTVLPESSARPRRTWRTRSPSTAPGWMELAVIPNGPSSSASVLVKPTRPHLVVE